MATAEERETTVTMTDADDEVRIFTSQRRVITALRKRPGVTEVRSGTWESTEWAEFTIPARLYDPARGVRIVRQMTDEQRGAMSAAARERFGHAVP